MKVRDDSKEDQLLADIRRVLEAEGQNNGLAKPLETLASEYSRLASRYKRLIKLSDSSGDKLFVAQKLIEKDLELATEVQSALLPSRDLYSHLSGMSLPAKVLGGDLYDYFELRPSVYAFVVADVSGKGIAAALVMAQVISLFRHQIKNGASLAQAVQGINQSLLGSQSDRFLTLLAGVVDVKDQRLEILNCGHVPAIVISEDGRAQFYEAVTHPLGIEEMPDADLRTYLIDLHNASFYCMTDGVTEGIFDGLEFGEKGVVAFFKKLGTLSPKEQIGVCERLFQGRKIVTHDDVTLLILKFADVQDANEPPPAEKIDAEIFRAVPESLSLARAQLRAYLKKHQVKNEIDIIIASGEVFQNIVRYAYRDVEPGSFSLHLEIVNHEIVMTIMDDAPPAKPELFMNTHRSATEAGGMGIALVKSIASHFEIQPLEGGNRTILRFKV